MGQAQSQSQSDTSSINETSEETPSAPPSSMDSLIAEAAAYGDGDGGGENESTDAKAKKALECPCIADLRKGACGSQFSEAFLCFLKSTEEEKGSDCVHPFVALQNCIKVNPNAFAKDTMEDDQVEAEKVSSTKYRILPPKWALESSSPKPRL